MGGSGGSMYNVSSEPISARTGEYNGKREYGAATGGWLAFIGIAGFIVLFLVLGNL